MKWMPIAATVAALLSACANQTDADHPKNENAPDGILEPACGVRSKTVRGTEAVDVTCEGGRFLGGWCESDQTLIPSRTNPPNGLRCYTGIHWSRITTTVVCEQGPSVGGTT